MSDYQELRDQQMRERAFSQGVTAAAAMALLISIILTIAAWASGTGSPLCIIGTGVGASAFAMGASIFARR